MEIITVILSAIMGLFSPVGIVTDAVAEDAIRDQLDDAEAIAVRIDATPSHQLLAGRVDRVRIAGRGLYPLESVRIAALDIDTDLIDVDFSDLRRGDMTLDEPFQGVVRLVLTVEDINQALRSPLITENLRDLSLNLVGEDTIGGLNRSDVVTASLQVVEPNRLRFQTLIREQNTGEELDIVLGFRLMLQSGHQVQIQDFQFIANGEEFPPDLLMPLVEGVNQEFTLRNLEPQGITLRLLELEIEENHLKLVAFTRIDPSSSILDDD